jgi:hypothetical protein
MVLQGSNMEPTLERIPSSLHGDLSKKLIEIVLDTKDKNAIPTDLAKKIIYLWRQDQLATKTGIEALIEGAIKVDSSMTFQLLDELGLQEVSIALKAFE